MRKFLPIAILLSMFNLLIADEEWLSEPPSDTTFEVEPPEEEDRIFKWAWELPNYGDTYPIAKRYIWSEPNSGGEIYTVFSRTRNRKNGDAYAGFIYGAFRPFALDFDTYSVVFGISYIGGSEKFYEADDQDQDVVNGDPVDIIAKGIDGETSQQAVNFSAVASFPEYGLQCFLDFGMVWTYIRIGIDELNFLGNLDIGGIVLPFDIDYDDYSYKQRDEGIYLAFEVRKLYDQTYFNYFSFLVYGVFNHGTTRRSSRATVNITIADETESLGRVDLPSGVAVDPQDEKDFDTGLLGSTLTARLFSYEMSFWIVEKQSISLDAVGGIEYSAGELFGDDFHGAALSAGAQVSFFDVMSFGYSYTWNMSNDLEDEWDLVLTVGIYGGLGDTAPKVRRVGN